MEIIGKLWKITLFTGSLLFVILLVGKVYGSEASADPDFWLKLAPQATKSTASIKNFIKSYDSGRYYYIASGPFTYLPPEASYGIWVRTQTEESVQSGREKAVKFLHDYVKALQTDKETTKYFEYQCIQYPKKYSGKLSLKNVGVRIAYWDEQVERPKAPYLSEIDFYDNTFRYYEADPKTQGLRLIREESYEKAIELLQTSPKPLE